MVLFRDRLSLFDLLGAIEAIKQDSSHAAVRRVT